MSPNLHTPDDPFEFPSDEAITEMSSEDQVEALCGWFHWNFEDPANMTPYESREGGYLYIWGGPYDANEQLGGRFAGVVPDEVIEAAADEVQSGGLFDWAPASRRLRDDYEEYDEEIDAPETTEQGVRERVSETLDELENAADAIRPYIGQIGHNNPPEPISEIPYTHEDDEQVRAVLANVRDLLSASEEPNGNLLSTQARILSFVAGKIGGWMSQKADITVDAAAKSFGTAIGKLMATGVAAVVGEALFGLLTRLLDAAAAIRDWVAIILIS